MMKQIKQLIKRIVPNYFKFNLNFLHIRKNIKKYELYTNSEISDFQEQKIKKLLIHCYENVPYYTNLMVSLNVSPYESASSIGILKKLPILTKDKFRKNIEQFKAKNSIKFKPSWKQTSGSTGAPTKYMQDKQLDTVTRVIVNNHYQNIGHTNGYIAVFRGTLIDDFENKEMIYKILGKEIHFSTFKMDDKVINKYIEILNQFKPEIIRGYPSALLILLMHIKKYNLKVHQPKALHTSSEVISEELIKLSKDFFNCQVYDYYSQGEASIIAYTDVVNKQYYKVLQYFSYVEYLDQGDGTSSIVGTNLWNYSMPLLRYETEDLTLNNECLDQNLLKNIIGRKADIVEGKNGKKISPSSFHHYWKSKVDKNLKNNVSFYQVIQKKEQSIFLVKVVKKKCDEDEKVIKIKLLELLGQDAIIIIEYLDEIPSGQKWRTTVVEK